MNRDDYEFKDEVSKHDDTSVLVLGRCWAGPTG